MVLEDQSFIISLESDFLRLCQHSIKHKVTQYGHTVTSFMET